jgi:hypothetical protein
MSMSALFAAPGPWRYAGGKGVKPPACGSELVLCVNWFVVGIAFSEKL